MDKVWEDFETGEIHVRDKWQFELKSDFYPISSKVESVFTQEFYIFIPNSLQINDQTYSKARFYEDQTNLIRYKTPEFSFSQLNNPSNPDSPLVRLRGFNLHSDHSSEKTAFVRELKLFVNIFRSTLRDSVHSLIQFIKPNCNQEALNNYHEQIDQLISNMRTTLQLYNEEEKLLKINWSENEFIKLFDYTRDYLSITINNSLSALLEAVRKLHEPSLQIIDEELCQILREEKKYREEKQLEPSLHQNDIYLSESILYQSGLLNKFFIDVLLLNTSRAAIDQKYRNLIGGIAAAVAMLFYILLFIWQGAVFVINSEPFILFTVIIYVLKDRLKDELKTLSFNQAFRWFSDYKTEIISPSGRFVIGELKESFSFIDEKYVPENIAITRNREFHTYLETIKRPERVIYYKKNITVHQNINRTAKPRLNALNIIFRYDIHRFLTKASDPYEPHVTLDFETLELTHMELPKIYHVNIILKNTYERIDGSQHVELKKFRLVLDKEGIKRVENIETNGRHSNV